MHLKRKYELEVISKSPAQPSQFPPILLVHGAWHGAWCWENTFLDYFSESGWEVYAMSLRGHGMSEGREKLRWWSIADYVTDVDQVVKRLGRAPIIVGHSMGGFVTQKYMETHSTTGAVLLASVPPSGTLKFNLQIIRRHPVVWLMVNLMMNTYLVVKRPEHAREWFFSEGLSDEMLAKHHAQLQEESYRASLDMLGLNLPKPSRVRTPVAVLGAENDAIFSVAEIKQTAQAYGVEAQVFPAMAHNMMCERNWQAVAEWIARWGRSISNS